MRITPEIFKQTIPALEEVDKALTNKAYRDIAMTAQTNVFFMMGMENPELMAAGFADYDKILKGFHKDILNVITKFRSGSYTTSTALTNAKNLFGQRYTEMFQAGTKAIGNPYYQEIGMTRKDLAFINKARRAEMIHFKRFLSDIRSPTHKPVHPYSQRAGYYAESGKAQFYNGMVAGAGTELEIWWVTGVPMTKHCDVCPIYRDGSPYTWETLPTVPRGGDSPCLWKCYCSLEIRPRTTGKTLGLTGKATDGALMQIGRYSNVADANGIAIGGAVRRDFDDMFLEMYKARQMTEITTGAEQRAWIQARRKANQAIIERARGGHYTVSPTISVKDLRATIQAANESGGSLVNAFQIGLDDELLFVRSDYSALGVIFSRQNKLHFRSSTGVELEIQDPTDILFLTGARSVTATSVLKPEID